MDHMGPLTESADEFATFELARLGYDVETGRETFDSTEDANDLLLLTRGDTVSPAVFAGLVWAVRNRPVNWALHLHPANPPAQLADLRRVLEAAGMSHLLQASA
jgi:hypothetical protein